MRPFFVVSSCFSLRRVSRVDGGRKLDTFTRWFLVVEATCYHYLEVMESSCRHRVEWHQENIRKATERA